MRGVGVRPGVCHFSRLSMRIQYTEYSIIVLRDRQLTLDSVCGIDHATGKTGAVLQGLDYVPGRRGHLDSFLGVVHERGS